MGIDSQYFEPVINGMQAVVDNGTAVRSKIPGIVMCGKTGTAQVAWRGPLGICGFCATR